jgi:hypothetical protein
VFPSFIGKDTRDDFTSHLYDAVYNRVETFLANELEKGEEITPVLLRTLEESRILVIIFPEGYEFSSWCVDELVKMLECKMEYMGKLFYLNLLYKIKKTKKILANLLNLV